MTNAPSARAVCLGLLEEILENGAYSHIALKRTLTKYQDLKKEDRAFITRVVEGTIEHLITIDYMIDCYSKTKVRKMKPAIRNILRMSVYQMKYMTQIPESAICNEAVKLAKKRGFQGLGGFVNGILRTMIREPERCALPDKKKDMIAYLSVSYSMPKWIIEVLHKQYNWETVERSLEAFVQVQKTSIRCNESKITPEQLEKKLIEEGVQVEKNQYLKGAFLISNYDHLNELDSFKQGFFQVQDVASMLVATCAGIKKDDFIVDVCAAPGGKSLHAANLLQQLDSTPDLKMRKGMVISRDLTEKKVGLIKENQERLQANNMLAEVYDATVHDQKLIGQADVVIADLPCSGLGVIGKKPDIKYKIEPQALSDLAKLQRQILDVVTQYVKPGGTLMYSTCTMNYDENQGNMEYIVDSLGFELQSLDPYLPENLKSTQTSQGYLCLVPGTHESDGFFIARLVKKG